MPAVLRRATTLLALALAAVATVGLVAIPAAAGPGDGPTVSKPRYDLTPRYAKGERFRVKRVFGQSVVTVLPQGFFPQPPFDMTQYDAHVEADALVTVLQVDPRGGAIEWSARFDTLRFRIPTVLQSAEYRKRARESKRDGETGDVHPLQGETVRFDASGKKSRVYLVKERGDDAKITERYPELLPLMQDLVDPDWVPVDTVPLYTEWEMTADHIFRIARVLTKSPIQGKIRCRLVSVADGIASIDVHADLAESYRRIDMSIQASGKIEFDTVKHRPVSVDVRGEVQISSETSSIHGSGTIHGMTRTTPLPRVGDGTAPPSTDR